jgi:hypothetical protein
MPDPSHKCWRDLRLLSNLSPILSPVITYLFLCAEVRYMNLILSNTYVALGGIWEMLISISSIVDRYLTWYECCRQWEKPIISQEQQLITKHAYTRQFHDGMSDYGDRTIQRYTQVTCIYQNVFRYVAIYFYVSLNTFPSLKLQHRPILCSNNSWQ